MLFAATISGSSSLLDKAHGSSDSVSLLMFRLRSRSSPTGAGAFALPPFLALPLAAGLVLDLAARLCRSRELVGDSSCEPASAGACAEEAEEEEAEEGWEVGRRPTR